MVFGICLLVAIYILYVLLVKGVLWKLILGGFGWVGMYWFLQQFPACQVCPLNISGITFSWASIVPTILVVLVLAHTDAE